MAEVTREGFLGTRREWWFDVGKAGGRDIVDAPVTSVSTWSLTVGG